MIIDAIDSYPLPCLSHFVCLKHWRRVGPASGNMSLIRLAVLSPGMWCPHVAHRLVPGNPSHFEKDIHRRLWARQSHRREFGVCRLNRRFRTRSLCEMQREVSWDGAWPFHIMGCPIEGSMLNALCFRQFRFHLKVRTGANLSGSANLQHSVATDC